MIPTIMRLDVRNSRNERVRLFLLVIIVWVLAFVLLIAAFPLVLIAALVTAGRGPGFRLLRFYPAFFEILFALSGLRIDVAQHGNKKVFIAFT